MNLKYLIFGMNYTFGMLRDVFDYIALGGFMKFISYDIIINETFTLT